MDITLPADSGLTVARERDVVTVTLDQPDRRNPQTPATWRALASIAAAVPEDVVAMVIKGAGSSFSAGLDRRMFTPEGVPGEGSFLEIAGRPPVEIDAFIAELQSGFAALRAMRPIVIALVQGHAIGAGFQLALAADMMIVADNAELSMKESRLGLIPDLTGTHTLVRAVGYSRALEMCITGRSITGPEAAHLGLAIACVKAEELDASGDALIEAVRTAPLGAALDLKPLLLCAQDAEPGEQHSRERLAQVERLRTLRSAMVQ